MSYAVPTSGVLWWVECPVYYRQQIELILLFLCVSVEWVESLGALLIVLLRILPLVTKELVSLVLNREADQFYK